jgi:hypothetical protein
MKFDPLIDLNNTGDMNDEDFGDGNVNTETTTNKKRKRTPCKWDFGNVCGNDSVAYQLLQQQTFNEYPGEDARVSSS